MPRLIALVGLPGSGKSVVTDVLVAAGYEKIYFGGLTLEKVREAGLEVNEKNERAIREQLRAEHGMAAYATLNIPKIEGALVRGNVVVDGLYSWEEYLVLKEKFPFLEVLAVYAPPSIRYARLKQRPDRPLNNEEAQSRDIAEIEKLHKAGPIAMADWTFANVGSTKDLISAVGEYLNADKKDS